MNRAIANIVIIGSVFIFPWWLPCILSLIAVFIFDYPEIIIVGALLDGVYGLFGFHQIIFTVFGLVIFVASLYLKPKLSLYNPL